MSVGIDGANADDPGIRLLASTIGDPDRTLAVCTGELPGAPRVWQLALDTRELGNSRVLRWPTAPEGLRAIPSGLASALVWPRAHLGKDFAQQCLAIASQSLGPSGRVYCAVRKQKGADSLGDFMTDLFGRVSIQARDRGYRLFVSTCDSVDPVRAQTCLQLQYEIRDPLLGPVALGSAPGVFSRAKLDDGTRTLIAFAQARAPDVERVLDLCCGIGPLGLWAAGRWSNAEVLLVETNVVAVHWARKNAAALGFSGRVAVVEHDGLEGLPLAKMWTGKTDLALVNPPTHRDTDALRRLLAPLGIWLRPGGTAFIVANRPEPIVRALAGAPLDLAVHTVGNYGVVEARSKRAA